MSALIDVIVPIYNASCHISGMLQNFEKQLFRDFRVIFVNDGSSDDSLVRLEEGLKHVTFPHKVISRENGGAAAARNTGLRLAEAPWTVCIDCDDVFLPEFLLYLYRAASENNADFAYAQYKMVPENKDPGPCCVGELEAKPISPELCMKDHYTAWFPHVCMLFNREFFIKNDLFYDENCRYCEDNTFVTRAIAYADRIMRISNVIYLYYCYSNSLSHSVNVDKFMSGLASFRKMNEELKGLDRPAVKMFFSVSAGRFYLSSFRFSALQMEYKAFRQITDSVSPALYRNQISCQPFMTRMAGYLLLFSKRLFYVVSRLMFRN